MKSDELDPERAWPFLIVRRGIPLGLALLGMATALVHQGGRGWYLLFAMACLAEVAPSFKGGDAYLKSRRSIIRWDALWVAALRPAARMFGWEEAWIKSFCTWNNLKVLEVFQARPAQRAMILLPHCIQMARCTAPVLEGLSNCHQCGLCPLSDFLQASLLDHWNTRISNRSHKAYREAREFRPDLIVAVSCADRLLKGLVKLPEVPVYAIPLQLPHGMCVDTTFNVSRLQAAMEALVEPKRDEVGKVRPLRRQGIA